MRTKLDTAAIEVRIGTTVITQCSRLLHKFWSPGLQRLPPLACRGAADMSANMSGAVMLL
jgi:hypothetical protein